MDAFLKATDVIDWEDSGVLAQAAALREGVAEVLREGSGYCYAKSHLLAALLRANGLPAGFCYQRLSRDDSGAPYSLHGLNAVHLPAIGWYRLDARGNRPDIDAQFTPPVERLAFSIRLSGEADLPGMLADPLPVVVDALRTHSTADALWDHLPDLPPGKRGHRQERS